MTGPIKRVPGPRSSSSALWLVFLLGTLVAVGASLLGLQVGHGNLALGPAVFSYCNESRHADDDRYIQAAFATGLLSNPQNREQQVLVSEALWSSMNLNAKKRFAERFSCAKAGTGRALSHWEFRSDRDDQLLGTWTGTELSGK